MPYGRLDVMFPDGNFRSFPLVNSTESVGRSPGNTIKLDAETISRYHFSLTHQQETVRLADMDSQNGTYVDGMKVPDGDSVELRGGEEILIGELRIIFHIMDEMPTQPMAAMDDTTEIRQRADAPFQITVQPPPISIPPGAHASAELTIANTTDEKGYYAVAVSGVPRNWVRLDRPRVLLEPHESGQVVVNVRPAREPSTAPGEYTININVREENSPEHVAEAFTRVHILPYGGFGVALERSEIDARERFRLHLHNQGSADLPLVIGGSQRTPDVQVELVSSSQVTLKPDQRLVIQGYARPKGSKLLGQDTTLPFDIIVRSQQANGFMAAVGGKVMQRALFPAWLPYAGGAFALVVFAVLFMLVRWLTAPTPTVTAFSAEPLSAARGSSIEILWAATDVQELDLLVDETPIARLTPEAGRYLLDTEFLSANPVIMLRGVTGRRAADPIQQRIQVYEPMRRLTFDVTPPQVVQHVIQTLDISWEISNAAFVQIGGLEGFATGDVDLSARREAADSITGITGISASNLTIEIYAEDELGNVYNDTVVVESIPAQCSPLTEGVPLRSGPNSLNQQISTIQSVGPVPVVGRDITGAWIAVPLESDLRGWGVLEQFECANTFNPSNLRQIIDVTPPPSPSETPTATPTATLLPTATPTVTPGPVVTSTPDAGVQRSRPSATSSS